MLRARLSEVDAEGVDNSRAELDAFITVAP
jgi:hypothetical protein